MTTSAMTLPRLVSVSFLSDFMLYVIYTAVPFKALQLGADALVLGTLAALSTGAYASLAALFGRLSDSIPRTTLARGSCVGIILACLSMTMVQDVRWMLAVMPLIGASMSPFWPSVQAAVADISATGKLEKNLGRFNLGWSTGKACGFLVGGWFVQSHGTSFAFTFSSCVAFLIFFLIPSIPRTAPVVPLLDGLDETESERRLAERFRAMAWIANGVAFGVGATLNHHYPKLIQEFAWSPRFFGVFLSLVFFTQTLTFLVMMTKPGWWRFQRGRSYLLQFAVLAGVLSLPLAGMERVLVTALVLGLGLGNCYYASIYYSLHTHEKRGRNAGVHESLIGIGSMLIPFAGGVFAKLLDSLWAPYVVAAIVVGLAILTQEILFRRTARGWNN